MIPIRFETIRRNIQHHESLISDFLQSMDGEKEYFIPSEKQNMERILKAEVLIIAFAGNQVAGLTGIVKKYYFFPMTFIIVKQEYQEKGIGGFLSLKRKAIS